MEEFATLNGILVRNPSFIRNRPLRMGNSEKEYAAALKELGRLQAILWNLASQGSPETQQENQGSPETQQENQGSLENQEKPKKEFREISIQVFRSKGLPTCCKKFPTEMCIFLRVNIAGRGSCSWLGKDHFDDQDFLKPIQGCPLWGHP